MSRTNIQRIVSLAPSNTEILFALGENSKLVGVTEFCNYPPQAKLIDKIGGFSTPDIEKIISLHPDLVLTADFHLRTIVPQLRVKGINTYTTEAKTILDAPKVISSLGELIGCKEEALQFAKKIQGRIDAIRHKTEILIWKPRLLFICASDPLCIAQKSCTINKLIEIAGGINIMQDIDADNIDNLLEAIIKKNPQVIITSKGHRETTDLFSYVMNESRFKQTDAHFNNRIYQIDAELICRPGPRAVQGLTTLAKFIHPEIF